MTVFRTPNTEIETDVEYSPKMNSNGWWRNESACGNVSSAAVRFPRNHTQGHPFKMTSSIRQFGVSVKESLQELTVEKNGSNGKQDKRNRLNDLSGAEWIQETKSFFFQKGLGASHPHAAIEREHPAPFSYQDIQRLIAFFTKTGDLVLDPFSGVGSTAKACCLMGRRSVNIELSRRWHNLARKRIKTELDVDAQFEQEFICNDVRKQLPQFQSNTFDFIVTSPPYWSILNKKPDHKAMERVRQELAVNYSGSDLDLANITDYADFTDELVRVFIECGRVLKPKQYLAIVVSDFRNKNRLYAFHGDLIQRMQNCEVQPNHQLILKGVKVLLQNHKSLKPYGYPFAYVENIHHQYILIFQKQVLESFDD